MGGGSWDPSAYSAARSYRTANNIPDFGHDHDVKSGKASTVHPDLDPKRPAGPTSPVAGRNIRESRDSDEHPASVPLAVIFDVTGSMGSIPRVLQQKLEKLMDVVVERTGLKDIQVLVGAVGDATCDRFPLQIGQFESDNRFDEQLRNLILEGGGGGQLKESYGLAFLFAADHVVSDAWEKRGKKGYLFTMGDEGPWPTITTVEAERTLGKRETETVESVLARAQERWEIFHLFAVDGSYPNETQIHERWRSLLAERFIMVEDSSKVCEVIAGIIHMLETSKAADSVVTDLGFDESVRNALVPLSQSLVATGSGSGVIPAGHGAGAASTMSEI
jgi:hypothetical protein